MGVSPNLTTRKWSPCSSPNVPLTSFKRFGSILLYIYIILALICYIMKLFVVFLCCLLFLLSEFLGLFDTHLQFCFVQLEKLKRLYFCVHSFCYLGFDFWRLCNTHILILLTGFWFAILLLCVIMIWYVMLQMSSCSDVQLSVDLSCAYGSKFLLALFEMFPFLTWHEASCILSWLLDLLLPLILFPLKKISGEKAA